MIPNFSLRDPTLFISSYGSVPVFFFDDAGGSTSFWSGRYGPASGWQDNSQFDVSFDSGSHTVEIPFHGTHSEPSIANTTFYNGTFLFALIDGGTFPHDAAASISAGSGTHFHCAIVTDYGTEIAPFTTTFLAGSYNEVAVGPLVPEAGTTMVAFGTGSYYNAQPDIDPMLNKAVIRFSILPGSTAGDLEFTSQGNPGGYNTDYGEGHFTVFDTPGNVEIRFHEPWAGTLTSFDNRYQLLFDAPVFPNPPGAAVGIIIISDGTGTNVGSLVSEHLSFGASFGTGTYFHMVVAGSIPRDTVPNFCTFLYGSHTFIRETGSVTEDHGQIAASFGTGTYDLKVITGQGTDAANSAIAFYSGAYVLQDAGTYVTADSTIVTADCGTISADNCKPFGFDNTNWPTFDDNVVFNFSQL